MNEIIEYLDRSGITSMAHTYFVVYLVVAIVALIGCASLIINGYREFLKKRKK